MFLSVSRFAVANDLDEAVRAAFRQRPHQVDTVPGFIRMEVANPSGDPKEFWLLTWWQDEASFSAWHHSHAYHASHAGIPKGLKLEPGRTQMLRLEVFAS
ncbi:MAG: antibiotic biosynthesis monooxygenase [Rhodocyclaceae bacterium]|jgi:heme-degrading monooxygenase HmoA|nr:antibiotic biosynthesis monooxygenase [Rhodocyclaceae bacterium]